MDELFRQIRLAHDAGAELLALMALFALPDMCAALESENRRTSGSKYRAWVRTNLSEWESEEHALALYDFRCSLIHQGSIRGQRPASGALQLRFVPKNSRQIRLHNFILDSPDGGILVLDIGMFLDEVINDVSAWHERVKMTRRFQTNYEHFVQERPDGLMPLFDLGGVPVIG
jgi:hypothetical protein